MGLQVQLPMPLYCNNKGTVEDLVNVQLVEGRTRYVEVKVLRKLKENRFVRVQLRSGEDMMPDGQADEEWTKGII